MGALTAPAGAQGGLFEPEAPNRLIVPGAEGWWGIDPATTKYAIGTVDRDLRRRVHEVQLGEAGPCNGERLHRYAKQLRALIHAMIAEGCPRPGFVWVEQPSGEHPNLELVYAVAVCVQVTYEELRLLMGRPVRVETIPPKSWKARLAPGGGAWNKTHRVPGRKSPKRLPTLDYRVLQWARANGFPDLEDWDQADALGIAEGARKTYALV